MMMTIAELRWKDGSAVTDKKDAIRALNQMGMLIDFEPDRPEQGLWLIRVTGREHEALHTGAITKGSVDFDMEVKAL